MDFKFSEKSEARLSGVHPDLVKVVRAALEITTEDFVVLQGLRTVENQAENFIKGVSKKLVSRHLTGHAVDLGVLVHGKVNWSFNLYKELAKTMKAAAYDNGVKIVWGGDWLTFKDGVHFELDSKTHPTDKRLNEELSAKVQAAIVEYKSLHGVA